MAQLNTLNELKDNKARMNILRLNTTNYWVQSFSIPGIDLESGIMPGIKYDIPLPGSKRTIDTVPAQFIISQDMSNYMELIGWINEISTSSTDDIRKLLSPIVFDIMNGDNAVTWSMRLNNAYPINIGEVSFNMNDTTITPILCSVAFRCSDIEYNV